MKELELKLSLEKDLALQIMEGILWGKLQKTH